MKKIIFAIVFASFTCAIFAQTMVLKKADGTYQEVPITDAVELYFYQPCPGTPTVDYGGTIYNTIQIGTQCWLKENLNVGTKINSNSSSDNQTDNGTIEKYCYDNNESNCDAYGGLYQWDEAMQYVTTEGAQGICPEGWHIPTSVEFGALEITVEWNGNSLKSIGQGTGSGAGTNTSGFSALLAGTRYNVDGVFYNLGYYTNFWSSTELNVAHANSLSLYNNNGNIGSLNAHVKEDGCSVRCLKD